MRIFCFSEIVECPLFGSQHLIKALLRLFRDTKINSKRAQLPMSTEILELCFAK